MPVRKTRHHRLYIALIAVFFACLMFLLTATALPFGVPARAESAVFAGEYTQITVESTAHTYNAVRQGIHIVLWGTVPASGATLKDPAYEISYYAADADPASATSHAPLYAGNYIALVSMFHSLGTEVHQVPFVIEKRGVSVVFDDNYEFDYNGAAHTRSYYVTNKATASDVVQPAVVYATANDAETTAPTAAGTYGISQVYLPERAGTQNANYYIVENGIVTGSIDHIVIRKIPLRITLNPLTILDGETPAFVFSYNGFVGTDTPETALSKLPVLEEVPTKAGAYRLKGSGAEAENYDIFYFDGAFIINQTMLQASSGEEGATVHNMTLKGSFKAETVLNFTAHTAESNATVFVTEKLKSQNEILFKSDVTHVMELKMTGGGLADTVQYAAEISNVKLSGLFAHKVGVVDKNGNFYRVDSYTLKSGNLSFLTVVTDGYVVVYRDSLVTYSIFAGIALIILIIIILKIASVLSYRTLKKDIAAQQKKKKAEKRKVEKYTF